MINEFIYTPGQVQTATINKAGELKKTFDITPYDWNPGSSDDPLFDANLADDVIYGGLGDDFLHGAVGDDAILGAEALTESYTQLYNVDADGKFTTLAGIARSDWTRPYNTGDMVVFGNDDDSWHQNKPSLPGEFALYDEFDPRRVISLNANGTKVTDGPNGYNWFLNFASNEGPTFPGGVTEKGLVYPATNYDGRDLVFGDQGNDWLVGGTGRDDLWGGWGTDLLRADDFLGTTDGGTADNAPDTSPNYEDRAYAGAGYDILIGNTGGDRLIDWVGEFNSYIAPFAPFGIDAVSRQRPPMLDEFLYALSRADGADPTRWTDTTSDPVYLPRNGEPWGEIGLITQKDHGLWQDQTGGPTDPQPGNIPGGKRDVLNSADFNNGSFKSFRVDSGVWEVSQGSLNVAAASLGQDAAGVFYLDENLPVYDEMSASIKAQKPIGGWKANAYMIFDYFSPTDFKFAGIDVSINKFVTGHRNASGWIVDVQSPLQVKPDTFYNVLVAVNGTTVTVQVDAKVAFTYTFARRIMGGEVYGLNKGMVGAGSDNARGTWDNFKVQELPPELTLDTTEDFNDGIADLFTGDAAGAQWTAIGGRYMASAVPGSTSIQLIDLGVNHLDVSSYLELQAVVKTNGIGGIVFDENATNHYKYVALDVASQKVLIGHFEPSKGWVVDTSVSKVLAANTDYTLGLIFKGASVSVTVNGSFALSWGFNAAVVDGAFGVLSRSGKTFFDSFRIRTNDPAFEQSLVAAAALAVQAGTESWLTYAQLDEIVAEAKDRWAESLGTGVIGQAALDQVTIQIVNFGDLTLGKAIGASVLIDLDAAGWGWFVDTTPFNDVEFGLSLSDVEKMALETSPAFGHIDLLTVVMHELGHVLGFEDLDPNASALMSATLDEGIRRLPLGVTSGQSLSNSGSLICLDLAPDYGTTEDFLADLVNRNPWLIKYLSCSTMEAQDSESFLPTTPPPDNQGTGPQPSPEPVDPEPEGKGKTK